MTSLADNIAAGHALGFSFTPLLMVGSSAGKRPRHKGWQDAPRETIDQAVAFAGQGNVGLRTGTASADVAGRALVVIDLDAAKPGYDVDAVKTLALPLTVTAITGGGGYHLYYYAPAGVHVGNDSSGKILPCVDVRGTGGQVVYPGSVHQGTGHTYTWFTGRALGQVPIADLPAGILARLSADKPFAAAGTPALPPARNTGTPARLTREERYGRMALAGEIARVSQAVSGTRNAALNAAAYSLGQLVAGGVLQEDHVRSGLTAAAMAAGLGKDEALATIASGLKGGAAEARGVPATHADGRLAASPRPAGDSSPAAAPGDALASQQTDTGTPASSGEREAGGRQSVISNPQSEIPTGVGEPYTGDGVVPLGCRDRLGRLVLSQRRTLPTAWAYVHDFASRPEGRTLHAHLGRLVTWQHNCYRELEDAALRHVMGDWLHRAVAYNKDGVLQPFPANPTTLGAALETVRAHVHLDANREAPFWVSGQADDDHLDPRELLCCRSNVLHVPTRKLLPATCDLFSNSALDFDYLPAAPEPREWLRFLAQLWPDDLDSVALLQDWFGYCLSADTSQQKILLLQGPMRSGKGTIGRVLAQLVGAANVSGPTVNSLAEMFGLQQLVGKAIAIMSDARFVGPSVPVVVERLLCISGEDLIDVRRMYQPTVSCKLPTRFTILTNDLPQFHDTAGALAGRFLVLQLRESFFGREDVGLGLRLAAELPGILNWALEGWERLADRGKFLVPESSGQAAEMLFELSSPVSVFVADRCVREPNAWVLLDDLYKDYCAWCETSNRRPTSRQGFGRDLASALPGLRVRRNHESGRFYEGIGLRPIPDGG